MTGDQKTPAVCQTHSTPGDCKADSGPLRLRPVPQPDCSKRYAVFGPVPRAASADAAAATLVNGGFGCFVVRCPRRLAFNSRCGVEGVGGFAIILSSDTVESTKSMWRHG